MRHLRTYLSRILYARCVTRAAKHRCAGCTSVAGRPGLWCMSLALHYCCQTSFCYSGKILMCAAYGYPSSRTFAFTSYRSYPPCLREGTWFAIRESVGCEDLASLAEKQVCACATINCARVLEVYSTRVVRRTRQSFCALVALPW